MWKTTWEAANAAIKSGNLDEAKKLLDQAELEKRAEAMEAQATAEAEAATKAAAAKEIEALRPPFPSGTDVPQESGAGMAIKAAYVKKYGEIDAGAAQIFKELYGSDNYAMLHAVKMADMNRYCKYGIADPKLSRMVLLSPDQIYAAVLGGVPVAGDNYSIKTTMIEAQDTLLGYMVPETLNMEIIQRLPGLTVVRGLARKFDTGGDQLSFLVRRGGGKRYIGQMRSKQTSESPTAGTFDTNPLFGKINIPVHVNLSKVSVSKSGLEDSRVDVVNQLLKPEFETEAAQTEDGQFLTGSGAGEPQGILNGTAANGAPWNADVAIRPSGAASTIQFDAINKAPWDLAGQYRAKRNPSTAWAFTSATGQALSVLKDNEGNYLWTEMHGNNAQGNPDTLRGWQYKESEALPEIAANTYPVIFGDWQGYRIVDRVGSSITRYDDSATADTDSVVFFYRRRYGGQLAEGYRLVVIKIATS
jgi:HK97 family phage major capsid protein